MDRRRGGLGARGLGGGIRRGGLGARRGQAGRDQGD
jgi:hypothetical protein